MIKAGVDNMINNTEQETISIIQLTKQSSLAYQKVLAYVKDQNFVKANEYLIKGNETLLEASKIHAGCLTVSSDLDLLLVHAEDMLISVQLYKSLIKEFIDIYKKI